MLNNYPEVVDISDESLSECETGATPKLSPPKPPTYDLKKAKRTYDQFDSSQSSIVDLVDSDEEPEVIEIGNNYNVPGAGRATESDSKQTAAVEPTDQPRVREKTLLATSAFRSWVADLSPDGAVVARELRRLITENFEDAKNKQAYHRTVRSQLRALGDHGETKDYSRDLEIQYHEQMRDCYLKLIQQLGEEEEKLCYHNFSESIQRHSVLTENSIAKALRDVHDYSRSLREKIEVKLVEREAKEDSEVQARKSRTTSSRYNEAYESDSSPEYNDDSAEAGSSAPMSAAIAASLQQILASAQKPVTPVNLPKEMKVVPMAHQRLGLGWLLSAEQGPNKGSILADDMGLGKTIQALSLMVANRAPPEPVAQGIHSDQTLIICPVSLLSIWENEIKLRIDESAEMTVYTYHTSRGTPRNMTPARLRAAGNIVITTYSTLLHEHKALEDSRSHRSGSIFGVHWWRIVMDEAHNIKNEKSKTAIACCKLRAVHRLCLTGTPMQNKVAELWSLVKFLRIEPYWEDYAAFSQLLPPPTTDKLVDTNIAKESYKRLHVFLASILYRRTKDSELDGQKILKNLTSKEINVITVAMPDAEHENYAAVEARVKKKASRFTTSEDRAQNYLALITCLRMVTCHRLLSRITAYRKYPWADAAPNEIEAVVAADFGAAETIIKTNWDRAVCMNCKKPYWDLFDVTILVPCCHHICYDCSSLVEDDAEMISQYCSICAQKFDVVVGPELFKLIRKVKFLPVDSISYLVKQNKKSIMKEGKLSALIKNRRLAELQDLANYDFDSDSDGTDPGTDHRSVSGRSLDLNEVARLFHVPGVFTEGWVESAKVSAIVDVIKSIIATHPTDKILLFSSFTSMLDLLTIPLQALNVSFLTYTGDMNATMRSEVIAKFQMSAVKILLVSMKAGNTGLTLTEANHVIIAEPFWNPYVEEQAMDRAHRIGQSKPVSVYKIIVEKTIEDRIMQLQEQKKDAIDSALSAEGRDEVKNSNNQQLRFLLGL